MYIHIFETLKSGTVTLFNFVSISQRYSYFPWNTPLTRGVGDAAIVYSVDHFLLINYQFDYAGFGYNCQSRSCKIKMTQNR